MLLTVVSDSKVHTGKEFDVYDCLAIWFVDRMYMYRGPSHRLMSFVNEAIF